jgi:hypothetical protein
MILCRNFGHFDTIEVFVFFMPHKKANKKFDYQVVDAFILEG